jgi:Domain of unknown function (DUF4124)
VGRGSRRGAVVLVVFAVGAVAPQFGAAQQIYKWTDSQGQVHYSDHAESGQKTTTVAVPQAPPASSQAATKVARLVKILHDYLLKHTPWHVAVGILR